MSNPDGPPTEPPTNSAELEPPANDPQLDSIRSILFAEEQERIEALESEAEALRRQSHSQRETLQGQIDELQARLDTLRQDALYQRQRADRLQEELDQLKELRQADSRALLPRLVAEMSGLISSAVSRSRGAMADALGPVMGDAIQVQIRDSRDEMVEALYPVILVTVQRAISNFGRELQRNIDARLKTTFGIRNTFRALRARASGVSQSELILRDALPFNIEELFLIQRETGFLMAHTHAEGSEALDSDLISSMLTAIRDFARDSFGDGTTDEELDEIQFGDERIIIQSGQYVYIAAAVAGVEPEGFHTRLREFVSELHLRYKPQLRDYAGDPATLPDLRTELAALNAEYASPEAVASQPMSRSQKMVLVGGGLAAFLLLACTCFYLQFTVALIPLAFGDTPTATASATSTPTPTPSHTATPSPTSTSTPTPSPVPPTATPSPTAMATPTHTPTPTLTDTPLPTATVTAPRTLAPVWVRPAPVLGAETVAVIPAGTSLTVLAQNGFWVEVEWQSEVGIQRGWIPLFWVDLQEPIPEALITPTAGP